MLEAPTEQKNNDQETPNKFSRRQALIFGGIGLGAAFIHKKEIGNFLGLGLDALISPEDIIHRPPSALEPRLDDSPSVTPIEYGLPINIHPELTLNDDVSELSFMSDTSMESDHTGTAIQTDTPFTSRGTAIITTAEGLQDGEQAYCLLFENNAEQTIAVGYNGHLYTYDLSLASNETSGEWVRVVSREDGDSSPRPIFIDTDWEAVHATSPRRMLVEEISKGTETLQHLGYKPWGAVLPSTQMPGMKEFELNVAGVAQTPEEVKKWIDKKGHFISERGDIIDINHLHAKAEETLDLYLQLAYHQLTKSPSPHVSVGYSRGSAAYFGFAVAPESVKESNLTDTTFCIMNSLSVLMEGVSQQYANEKIPFVQDISPSMGGLNPEDLFTNSLGITGMIELIKHPKITSILTRALKSLYNEHPNATAEEMAPSIKALAEEAGLSLTNMVIEQVVDRLGVRKIDKEATITLPRGIFSLVPTKVSDADAKTPTPINLAALGIHQDNPDVQFTPTHIPAMQTASERFLSKLPF